MEVIDRKISYYFTNGTIDVEKTMKDYRNYIYAIIKRICTNLSEEDIEEVYIEVFFVLWQNQNKLDINKSMSSYLRAITRNLITHKLRKFNNIDALENEEKFIANFDTEFILIWQEKKKIIFNELKNLKSKEKEIFISYYYQNKRIIEISELFNLSKSNIKITLFRIRKRIKKALIKGGYDYNE